MRQIRVSPSESMSPARWCMAFPRIIPFLTLALIGSLAPAFAQDSAPPQLQKLSLPDALDIASKQNLDLAAGRLRQAVAEAGVRIAGQRPNPTLSFGASRDLPHENLLVDQPLELGGVRGRRIELAKSNVPLAAIEYSTLERQIRRKVREAYYGATLARGVTAFQARLLELAKRLHEITQTRLEAGDVAQLELVQADLVVARAETDLEVARQQEKTAFGQLNILLNEPSGIDWDLVTRMDAPLPSTSMDELILLAQQTNPELQHLAQEQRIEEAHRSFLQAQRTPHVALQFGSDFNAPPDFQVGPRGQIAVELPLFSRNQGELAQSQAISHLLESEVGASRRAITGRLQTSYLDLAARRKQVELYYDRLLPAGRRLAEMAEESYRAGKSGILTVLDAQRSAQQVEREYLDNLFSLQAAFAALEEMIGAPLN